MLEFIHYHIEKELQMKPTILYKNLDEPPFYRFYGCFYKDNHTWNCKEFETEKNATNYTTNYATINSDDKECNLKLPTLLIPINNYIPKIFDKYIITNIIKDLIKINIVD